MSVTSPTNAVEDVSGLYGPGAYASWILVIASALVNSQKLDATHGMDGEVIASVTYPIVAALDTLYRRCTEEPSPSSFASSRVAFGGMVLCGFGFWLTLHSPGIAPRVPALQRLCAWAGAYYVCYCACLYSLSPNSRAHGGVNAGFLFPIFFSMWSTCRLLIPFVSFCLCLAASMEGPSWVPIPITAATCRELDQAFSLGGTLIALAWQWKQHLRFTVVDTAQRIRRAIPRPSREGAILPLTRRRERRVPGRRSSGFDQNVCSS